MSAEIDEQNEEALKNQWKIEFCEHYANKLEKPEKIAQIILDGIHLENESFSELCQMVSLNYGKYLNETTQQEVLGHLMMYYKYPEYIRNTASFISTWNMHYIVAVLNCLLAQENYKTFIWCLTSLPTSSRVTRDVVESPILESVLVRFVGSRTQNANMDLAICLILSRMYTYDGSLCISERQKILMSEAFLKISDMDFDDDSKEKDKYRLLQQLMEVHLDPNVSIKEEILGKTNICEIKMHFKIGFQAKCFHKDCSKSMSDGVKYCKKCCFVSYCSPKCQRAHWKVHKKQCRILFQIGKNLIPLLDDAVQFLKDIS